MSSSPFGTPNMSGWASGPKGYIPWCGDGVRMMHKTILHPTPGLKDILRVRYVLQCSVLPHYPLFWGILYFRHPDIPTSPETSDPFDPFAPFDPFDPFAPFDTSGTPPQDEGVLWPITSVYGGA